jgi:hypothetical protein
MGIQVHCAECHTHPTTPRWKMEDFWGMAAFFGHTVADRGAKAKKGKKGNGPATIREVESRAGMGKKAKKTRAILAGLLIAIPDPTDPRKKLRTTRAKFFESDRPVPTGPAPYRPRFAAWLASPDNPYFARATVNRWWAHFFAKGLIHPIEDMHDPGLATHPALLRALADDFTRSGHDLKHLVRGIMNSRAYQRSSRPLPDNKADDKLLSHAPLRVLSAQQLIDSLAAVTGARVTVPAMKFGKKGAKSSTGTGGDPLVRFFDTREYDDDSTEFTYGIPQMLRLMNSNLTASSAAVAARLAKAQDRRKGVEELYLTALARRPSAREVEVITAYLNKHDDQAKGYSGALWALLNSAEFITNR